MYRVKFRVKYIYIIFLVAAISVLIIVAQSTGTKLIHNGPPMETVNKQMPEDETHKGLQNRVTPIPSKENVSENFKHEIMALKKAIDESPNDTAALKGYAELLVASHKPAEAIPLYDRILMKYPKRTDVLFSLSFIYFNNGNFRKAEEETKKILSYDKKNIQAQYNLGAIAASRGNSEEARHIWTKLLNDYPNSELSEMAKGSLNKLK